MPSDGLLRFYMIVDHRGYYLSLVPKSRGSHAIRWQEHDREACIYTDKEWSETIAKHYNGKVVEVKVNE